VGIHDSKITERCQCLVDSLASVPEHHIQDISRPQPPEVVSTSNLACSLLCLGYLEFLEASRGLTFL
jgi:hypothetical protein